jgi:hypothetical protein
MKDVQQIIIAIENFLIKENKFSTDPIESGAYLSKIGVLKDSTSRRGKPLRDILREGLIPHAYQNGKFWVIPRLSKTNQQVLKDIKPTGKTIDKTVVSGLNRTREQSPIRNTVQKNQNSDKFNPFAKAVFCRTTDLDGEILKETGFYCIRLKEGVSLPSRYQKPFKNQDHRIIYIGKAEGQSLGDRLSQELLHTSPGTFFRSIGAVLEKTPIPGHLANSKRKNNYKFSDTDTKWIIDWLAESVEVSIISYSGSFNVENSIIERYMPLLNHTGNPRKCAELIEDRAKCRKIASGLL